MIRRSGILGVVGVVLGKIKICKFMLEIKWKNFFYFLVCYNMLVFCVFCILIIFITFMDVLSIVVKYIYGVEGCKKIKKVN